MFVELAKAVARTAVIELMKVVGDSLSEILLSAVTQTKTKVYYDGEDVRVEADTDDVLKAALAALLRLKDKVLTYPRVAHLIDATPDALRIFLRSFVIGVKEALIESLSTQLFNDQWRQFNEGKAA